MARVSVHIVTYNSAHTITTCLESVLAQTYHDFCVCIIDNASTDDTVARIRALGLDVVVNPSNVGYAAAHNQAIEHTDSAYILTLNPDVRLEPEYLASLTEAMDTNPHWGSASGCLMRVESLDQSPQCIDSAGLLMRRNRRQGLRCEGMPIDQVPNLLTPIFGPDGAAAFYRRRMLDDIRLFGEVFDNDFFIQKEDIDICWRAQLQGWSAVYVPYARARHIRTFRPGCREAVSPAMRFYGVRNRYLLIMKNDIMAHFWHDLWPIVVYDVLILAYITLREQRSWTAILSAVSMYRRMMQKRQVIQSRRQVSWHDLSQWFVPNAS